MVDYRKSDSRLLLFLEEEMNIYLEIFGYIGSGLVIISMMMSSMTKLRIVNICGSVVCTAYALMSGTLPLAALNMAAIIVNLYRIYKEARKEK